MYAPTVPPVTSEPDATTVMGYLYNELLGISAALEGIEKGQYLPVLHVAPTRPRTAQVVFADGTDWDPGSGEGLYIYYAAAWHFLG